MAAAVREFRPQRSGVYGNLAYDLERELRERELSHAGEVRREAERPRTEAAPKTKTRTRTLVRERKRVALASVLGFTAVAALAVLVLLNNVALTRLSGDVAELKSQLSVLETEHVTLSTQYQRLYDLSSVKAAAEAAGMVKPRASQVYYVDLSGGDSAVVYQEASPGILSRALAMVTDGVGAVLEYFD